ncbi:MULTISPECIES: hypothetical protein [unclassified Streptomyces]|uniref:hypothetical protein n=1 Tax=unclassified Streptomyces TaxID=2593676 RepID=UPI00131DF65B|nr:hypothetical protein [Streptomyces sp. CB01635]
MSTTLPSRAKSDFSVKPFMGRSSWSVESSSQPGYGTKWLTEEHIKQITDAVAANLRGSGYTNINLDVGWNATWHWQSRADATTHRGAADSDSPGRGRLR